MVAFTRLAWATWPVAAVLAAAPASALAAGPLEFAQRAASAASGVVGKAEAAVKHGAKKTSEAIEQGVRATNRGADKVAAKVGLPAGNASAAKAIEAQR